jgi:hypothetical protein
MSTIALRRLSNITGIPDDRQVSFQIESLNAYWSRLTVTLHVVYHFGLPEHWTPDRRARFTSGFESSVRQWSRRHLLQSSGLLGTRHVEVHVRASATRAAPGLQWHVMALPPEAFNARSHVQYSYSGRLPRGSTEAPSTPTLLSFSSWSVTSRVDGITCRPGRIETPVCVRWERLTKWGTCSAWPTRAAREMRRSATVIPARPAARA